MADTVIRIKREEGFTVLPNALLRDQRLSLKTKGLFCMMLSFPGDWSYSVGGLVSVCGAGRDAIRSALRELEAAGYLEREKVHGERGRFSGTVYTLHTVSKTPWTENPPMVETGEADPPLTDYPTTADPTTENPPLQNKDNINTPYSPPEGDADRGGQNAAGPAREPEEPGPKTGRHEPDRALFDQFWAAYPRKQAKEKHGRLGRSWTRTRHSAAVWPRPWSGTGAPSSGRGTAGPISRTPPLGSMATAGRTRPISLCPLSRPCSQKEEDGYEPK